MVGSLDHGIAGRRRTGLHSVVNRLIVPVARAADAPGIEHDAPVGQVDPPGQMGVAAKQQAGADTLCHRDNLLAGPQDHPTLGGNRVEPVGHVARGRAVTQEDVVGDMEGRGQAAQPLQILRPEFVEGDPVDRAPLVGILLL